MKFVTFIRSWSDYILFDEIVKKNNETACTSKFELILGIKDFSRFGELDQVDLEKIISLNQKNKYHLVFEWDILETQNKFTQTANLILNNAFLLRGEFYAIRVQDPGAIKFVFEKIPWIKIQLVLENGNHNLKGLQSWAKYLGERLDRLVLSNELTREHLGQYAKFFQNKIEILVFGRILVFYSPRKLLSPLYPEAKQKIEVLGTSEEGPHFGFPIIENTHGSFMFNVKDLFLADILHEFKLMDLGAVRFDLRFDQSFKYLNACIDLFFLNQNDFDREATEKNAMILKKQLTRPVIKGFYQANKTDVLFSKLKNKKIVRRDTGYLGEVSEVEKELLMAIKLAKDIDSEIHSITIETPEGKIKTIDLKWPLKNTTGVEIFCGKKGGLVVIPYVRGVSVKSQIYLLRSSDKR